MPRIFKGTETLLKLFVPRVDEGNLETLKIALFTDDTNNAAEFYGDNMSIDGDTVYLKVNAWSFDMMNDGVLNYIAEIEIGEEIIITERQSNYYLKTPNQYVPVGPDLSDYYTKPEIDEMLEDIEVDVDLTGYATEQWVEDKTYATEQYVNDAIANIDIPEGGSGEQEVYIEEVTDSMTIEQFNRIYELSQSGKIVLAKYDGGVYPMSSLDFASIDSKYLSFYEHRAGYIYYHVYTYASSNTHHSRDMILENDKVFKSVVLNNGGLSKYDLDDIKGSLIPVIWGDGKLVPLNLDKKNQIASAIIGDKLYKWDFVNGELDGLYCSPEIIELGNSGGGSSSDECIIIYEPNAETYTDEEKAHNGEMIKKIHNGTVKTAYLRYRNHSYDDAYIYVPLAFGWEVGGDYGYMTGVCKYWYYGSLHYDYFAIDMDESGYALKFEVEPMETGSGGEESIQYIDVNKSDYFLDFWGYWGLLQATTVVVKFYGENGFETKSILNLVWVGEDGDSYMWAWLNTNTIIKWYQDNSYTIETIGGGSGDVDLSSYYTKEEVDGLIANINLGDGATIENIVANEVANQLTDNFKTINGESILGEGDITIQGGGDADLSNYYTKGEVDNLIANSGGGSGNISELFYPTITSPTIVGEMTFNDEQLPHVDISESVYCNFKARKTQSKDLWVNNIHIGTNTDTIKIASPYYESTENMSDGAQEVYAEFTTEGIKENGKYLEEKYACKGFITHPSNIGNFGYEDSAIVAYSSSHLEKEIVAKAWAESKALFVNLGSDVKKQIPVSIEAKYNSNTEIIGYEVWGWYSKTQTITWVFGKDSTSVTPTIE